MSEIMNKMRECDALDEKPEVSDEDGFFKKVWNTYYKYHLPLQLIVENKFLRLSLETKTVVSGIAPGINKQC